MQPIFPAIIIYKCKLQEAESYNSFIKANAFERFFVYDNSPGDYAQEDVAKLYPGVIYVRDEANSGLPKAYNLAAQKAKELGCKRLLLLDQDTHFPQEALQAYLDAQDFDGITAPRIITTLGKPFAPANLTVWYPTPTHLPAGEYSLYKYMTVNSGLCIPVELFLQAGGYNENVRLDFADFQFQRRVRKVNPRLLLLPITLQQDYSGDCHDLQKQMVRFGLYLESALHCETEGFSDELSHHYTVLRRTLSLTLHNQSPAFLKAYFSQFLWQRLG